MSKNESAIIGKIQACLLLCLVVYMAFLVAKGTWFFVVPESGKSISLPEVSTVSQKQVKGRESQLARFHLFGEGGKIVKKGVTAPTVAPKTNLRLVLKGVFTAEQGGASGAIVEEIGKSSDYYGLGDKMPGNATLEEVYSDRILLRRNGKLETLAFDDVSLGKENSISKGSPNKKKSSQARIKKVDTPEQFIDEAAKRLSENPDAALTSVGLSATGDGYVYRGGNPMLSGLNLKKGDVIRSVNGHSLGDVKKDKNLMKSLYEQGSLEVEIVRDGASFYINYPLR